MAGALGVQLGGPSVYGGILVEKPFIGEEKTGDRRQESGCKDVYLNASENALSIIKITSLLGFGLALLLQYLRIIICCK
jgi:adenosylcobinamide-phosphate synthase